MHREAGLAKKWSFSACRGGTRDYLAAIRWVCPCPTEEMQPRRPRDPFGREYR